MPLNSLKWIKFPIGIDIIKAIMVEANDTSKVSKVILYTSGFNVIINCIACINPFIISFNKSPIKDQLERFDNRYIINYINNIII